MRALVVCMIAAALACGHKDGDGSGGGSAAPVQPPPPKPVPRPHGPTGQPRAQPNLAVTIDGKPVTMATALAWQTLSGEVEVTASSLPVACDQVTGDMREIFKDEVTFNLAMGHQLQPDGSVVPAIRWMSYDASTTTKDVATNGSGDGVEGKPTTIDVDFEVTGTGNKKLAVKGTIDALGCPGQGASAPKSSPAEMPAQIEIAGKKFGVYNAMLRDVATRPQLVITTGTESCEAKPHEIRGNFIVTFHWFDKAKPEVNQIDIEGALLPHYSDQTYDKKKVKIDPSPPTQMGQVKLDADIKIGKYPVAIHGTVLPVICK
jgi:hypothetical protein